RDGRPEYLRQQAIKSPGTAWARADPTLAAPQHRSKSAAADGIIRHAGLSNVPIADLEAALKLFKVATVQNRYNLVDRSSEDVLDYCEKHGIGFLPWAPAAAGRLSSGSSDDIAKAHGATPSQIALAWLLKRSPVMLPI